MTSATEKFYCYIVWFIMAARSRDRRTLCSTKMFLYLFFLESEISEVLRDLGGAALYSRQSSTQNGYAMVTSDNALWGPRNSDDYVTLKGCFIQKIVIFDVFEGYLRQGQHLKK